MATVTVIGIFRFFYPKLINNLIGRAQFDIDQSHNYATILCISITYMDQSISLKRKVIIKESDVSISYHSVKSVKKKFTSFCRP